MKRLILIVLLSVPVLQVLADKERYVESNVEEVINKTLDDFFESTSFKSLFEYNNTVNFAVPNKEFLSSFKKNEQFTGLQISSSIFPDALGSALPKNISFPEFLDTVSEWFPLSADKLARTQGNYLLNKIGDVQFLWERGSKGIHNSFYFQNRLFINVEVNFTFSGNYFSPLSEKCSLINDKDSRITTDTISITDVKWQTDSLGREFIYTNHVQEILTDAKGGLNFKQYAHSTNNVDTLIFKREYSDGLFYKDNVVGETKYVILTDSVLVLDADYVRMRNRRYNSIFYFTFVVDLPNIKYWNKATISPHLIQISDQIPVISEIAKEYYQFRTQLHLDLSLGNNLIPLGGKLGLTNNVSSGVDAMLNVRFKEKPYGLTFGIKGGVGIHQYGASMYNYSVVDIAAYNEVFEFGNFKWVYNADIDQLKTSWMVLELPVFLNTVYKPAIRGSSLNLELDFAIGYKYGLVLSQTVDVTGSNSHITTSGIHSVEGIEITLEDRPEYGFQTYNAIEIADRMQEDLSATLSNILISFQPKIILRNNTAAFFNITYSIGLNDMLVNDFKYVGYSVNQTNNVEFGNPLFTDMGKAFNTLRFSFGLSIPLLK